MLIWLCEICCEVVNGCEVDRFYLFGSGMIDMILFFGGWIWMLVVGDVGIVGLWIGLVWVRFYKCFFFLFKVWWMKFGVFLV